MTTLGPTNPGRLVPATVDHLQWPLTISHRGGPGVYPEHSWEAKTGSVASGFVPEFDLRVLADGRTLVNCHDETVDRTMINIAPGAVRTKTVAEWRRARIRPAIPGGAEGRPVFFDELLDTWGGRFVLVAELKDDEAVEVFTDSILSRGAQRAVLAQSFNYTTATRIAAAGIPTMYLSGTTPAQSPAQLSDAGIGYFGGDIVRVPTATVRALQAAGIRTAGFTVHTLSESTTPAALAWDGLFSDDAWRTTQNIPIRSGDPFADGIRPYGMDVYTYDPATAHLGVPDTPIRLAGRRLGFSQASSQGGYASQPWAGKELARPLRVSMRLWFGAGDEQSAGLGFALSSAGSGGFVDGARPGQQAFQFVVRRNGQLAAWSATDGEPPVLLGATEVIPGREYAPAGWEGIVDLSVVLDEARISLQAQSGGSAPAQRLVISNAFAPTGLELCLRWAGSARGASGFISDIDITGL